MAENAAVHRMLKGNARSRGPASTASARAAKEANAPAVLQHNALPHGDAKMENAFRPNRPDTASQAGNRSHKFTRGSSSNETDGQMFSPKLGIIKQTTKQTEIGIINNSLQIED
jgi:hypothetical protein